jgi:uncharacterized membrane protein YeaQ/YmgE (transglycosylase-associated protein family)
MGRDIMAIFLWIIIGLVTGWAATLLFDSRGGGLPNNLAAGLVGGLIGGFGFTHLSPAVRPNFFGSLGTAVIGAIIVLALWRLFRRA